MTPALLSLTIAALAAVIYWVGFCWRDTSLTKSVIKTASVGLLALAALVSGAPLGLTLALALGAAGDWFISRDGERNFLAGVASFAASHIAYIWLILQHDASIPSRLFDTPQIPALIILLLLGGIMAPRLWAKSGELRIPVLIYLVIILAMGIAAITIPFTPDRQVGAIVIAAACFILSDTILATELFLLPEHSRVRRITPFLIWGFYWVAQVLFLIGLS